MTDSDRFAIDKKGTVHNNIVDTRHHTPNGPGIIATSHNDRWAQTIVDCLNYCDVADICDIPLPLLASQLKVKKTDKEPDHDS